VLELNILDGSAFEQGDATVYVFNVHRVFDAKLLSLPHSIKQVTIVLPQAHYVYFDNS